MHRDPTRPPGTPDPPFVLSRWTTADVDRALRDGHLRVLDGPGTAVLLVSGADDSAEIARAAWDILVASGGLVDRSDIRRRWDMSRARVYELSGQRHFPAPVGEIGGRPVWLSVEVDRYRAQPPPTGRPRRSPAPPGDDT